MAYKLKNKGISYVEFILVISIIVLLTGFITITMSIVNRNNVNKAADKVVTGMNQAKTLSLSKGSKKGAITFAAKGGKYYYYYGSSDEKKYYICNSPTDLKVTVNNVTYNITDSQRIKFLISPSTGGFTGVDISLNGGTTFTQLVPNLYEFVGTNGIEIRNKQGKTANLDLKLHVGNVSVSY